MKSLLLLLLLPFSFSIGDDPGDWTSDKPPLHGKVKKVTLYSIFRPERNAYQATTIYWYSPAGKITRVEIYDDNVLLDSVTYDYDAKGNLLTKTSKSWRTLYTKGQNGKIAETNRYKTGDNSLMEKVLISYDANGNEREMNSFAGTGAVNYHMVISSAKATQRQEISHNEKGELEQFETFERDDDGNITTHFDSSVFFGSANTRLEEFEYIYADQHQNWLKRKIKVNSNGIFYEEQEERTIEYY